MNDNTPQRIGSGELHRRDTRMPDGRYLIYYTFDDEDVRRAEAAQREALKLEAQKQNAAPQAEIPDSPEARRV